MEPEISLTHLPSVSVERTLPKYSSNIERDNVSIDHEKDAEKPVNSHEKMTVSGVRTNDASITTSLLSTATKDVTVVNDVYHTDNPSIASNDGLIEKEWVNKAKKIISDTRNDPYEQEKAVNELQSDYLKKRYGESLGVVK